jgi:hypothetical protein
MARTDTRYAPQRPRGLNGCIYAGFTAAIKAIAWTSSTIICHTPFCPLCGNFQKSAKIQLLFKNQLVAQS